MQRQASDKTLQFIKKARIAHGDKYDYSKSVYEGSETKLEIRCPKHGPFFQTPYVHTSPRTRCGCPKCGDERSAKKQIERTAKKFLERSRAHHGDKYDYSNVRYVDAKTKVLIACPIHGDFWQVPNSHVRGLGCWECGVVERARQKREKAARQFIEKARKAHGDRYDYSATVYTRARDLATIVCPKHGPFLQRPNNHLRGVGCPGCKFDKLRQTFAKGKKEFVADARKIHGDRFRYLGEYRNANSKIEIVCPDHGSFGQRPADHLRGQGCPVCAQAKRIESATLSHAEFLARVKNVHAGKGYEYPERYVGWNDKLTIVCPKHGPFRQTPNNHFRHGCIKCQAEESSKRQRIGHKAFVAKARKVHGMKYRYPDPYQTAIIPIEIVCRKHGGFRQIPNVHLSGSGCPACSESKGEIEIAKALRKLRVRFGRQKGFPGLRDKYPLRFDFFCPDIRLLIEFDGIQHFQPVEHWGGDEAFAEARRRDEIKTKWATGEGLRLLRIPYTQTDSIEDLVAAAVIE